MGTWDVGPFGNDTAADFGGNLDEAAAGEHEGIVRSALIRVIDTAAYLEAPESEEAITAAALVAAQCPGGEPTDPVYGPEEPLPDLTGLRDLALQSLDRVLTDPSELMDLWADGWRTLACGHPPPAGRALPHPSGEQLSLS
ncbi:DUF4259 domain-containing protein [Streptomyces sp. 35G-GA-8]|uniref:DUF4259 domain-containing protein n=1 Tax=Streptomyces sp. 35G-GA-8 TaxID=2939434 RepID=UPI00201F2E6D|nr:DUF4259 domain-containing protein [Streptomyces sp. 35G-GA-8]